MASYDCVYLTTSVDVDSRISSDSKDDHNLSYDRNFKTQFSILRRCRLRITDSGLRLEDYDSKSTIENYHWSAIRNISLSRERNPSEDLNAVLTFQRKYAQSTVRNSMRYVTIGLRDEVGFRTLEDKIYGGERQKSSPEETTFEEVIVAQDNTKAYASAPPDEPPMSSDSSPKSRTGFDKPVLYRKHSGRMQDGRCIYLLNRCLDDIHHYAKQVNRCVKSESSSRYSHTPMLVNVEHTHPLSPKSSVEWLRKIKYALNLNQEIENIAPEAAHKVYMRLMKMVHWMRGICESRIIPKHDEKLLPSVVEPLLTMQTLVAIMKRMPSNLKEDWGTLGAAWNTPINSWPCPLKTYVPQFRTIPKSVLSDYARLHMYRNSQATTQVSRLSTSEYVNNILAPTSGKGTMRYTHPYFRSEEQFDECKEAQNKGESLCFATAPHRRMRDDDLDARQGEVFTIINDKTPDYWTVRDSNGVTGQLPKQKLRKFTLTQSMTNLIESPMHGQETRSATYRPYKRDEYGRPESMARQRDHLRLTRAISLTESETGRRSVSPILVDLPFGEIKRMHEQRSDSIPMLVIPYDNIPHGRYSSVDSASSLPGTHNHGRSDPWRSSSIQFLDEDFDRMRSLDDLQRHPYPVQPYRATLVLRSPL